MNASDIHEALSLLPDDLVLATDNLRRAPKQRTILRRQLVPLAACLAVLLSAAMVFYTLPFMGGSANYDRVSQAPAEAMPMDALTTDAKMEAAQDAPAENGVMAAAPPAPAEDYRHTFAEEAQVSKSTGALGGCGNTQVTITLDGQEYTISGSDAIAVKDILANLPYDPDAVCRCMAPVTVDTEILTEIHLNLEKGFARCEQGQADLTEAQAQVLQGIVDALS